MGGWLNLSVIALFCLITSFLVTRSGTHVSCIITGSIPNHNGYYSALDGLYLKRGTPLARIPDFFSLMKLKRNLGTYHTISLSEFGYWSISDGYKTDELFTSSPINPTENMFFPPRVGWYIANTTTTAPSLTVECTGMLSDGLIIISRGKSNLEKLLDRPANSLILLLIVGVAGYLYLYKIPVEDVSFSYATAMEGQYWRFFTASMSHFDLLHLFFNASSFYELGSLEPLIGTASYLALNVDLIIITMILCVAMSYVLIHYFNRESLVTQQSIGFSCVLFAWMVVSSVYRDEFCPIFFLPSLCIPTWNFAVPFLPSLHFPINLGPFVILLVTKLIIPRSSFLGHLSGIIIGYPLAWGLCNWLSPPVMTAICICALIYVDSLYIWNFPGFRSDSDLTTFVPVKQMIWFRYLWVALFIYAIYTIAMYPFLGLFTHFPRFVLVYLLYCSIEAKRCEWLTDAVAIQERCVYILQLTLFLLIVLFLHDCLTTGGIIGAYRLVETYSHFHIFSIEIPFYLRVVCLTLLTLLELCMVVILVVCLQTIPRAKTLLQLIRINPKDVTEDLRVIGLSDFRAYSGRMHTLQVYASAESASLDTHLERGEQPPSAVIV